MDEKKIIEVSDYLKVNFNKLIRQIIKDIDIEIDKNKPLIKDLDDIEIIPLSKSTIFNWSKEFHSLIEELSLIINHYQKIIPEFECNISIFPFEHYFHIGLNHTSKSIIDKDLIEKRRCHLFQNHSPESHIRYSFDQDYGWNNYRVTFYFEFPLKYI